MSVRVVWMVSAMAVCAFVLAVAGSLSEAEVPGAMVGDRRIIGDLLLAGIGASGIAWNVAFVRAITGGRDGGEL